MPLNPLHERVHEKDEMITINPEGNMNVFTKSDCDLSNNFTQNHKSQPNGVASERARGSTKLSGCIVWKT